jgi:hypothetical protein
MAASAVALVGLVVPCVSAEDSTLFPYSLYLILGARGSVVVIALCYKPEGRRFENR